MRKSLRHSNLSNKSSQINRLVCIGINGTRLVRVSVIGCYKVCFTVLGGAASFSLGFHFLSVLLTVFFYYTILLRPIYNTEPTK